MSLILTIGPSGSCKTTWAENYCRQNNIIWLSSDKIREIICGNASDQSKNNMVFLHLNLMCEYLLRFGLSVVVDATNLSIRDRKGFIETGKKLGAYIEARVFKVPYEICVLRDAKRSRNVGSEVIKRQFDKYQEPNLNEGFDIIIHNTNIELPELTDEFLESGADLSPYLKNPRIVDAYSNN